MEWKNMKEISEVELHLYFQNKSLLEDGIINEIEIRLESDQKLLAEFEEIKEFYANLKQLNPDDRAYLLNPMESNYAEERKIVLAAQQSAETESKLHYVRTFISSEKYVMVRMFHNPQEKEYELYVICEDNEIVKNAVIRIPFLNQEIITDEKGFARVIASYLPDDIELNVVLK